jgi:DNA (cytosine-5)-methyltransferase 1
MKILNLYAGLGGNRKLWGASHEITAVEYDRATADAYSTYFPNDEMIVDDAHDFLLKNYMNYDFIWASPPCPSHSDMRRMWVDAGRYDPVYPDMQLYQEIILLKQYAKDKIKFVIENVKPYYNPLIPPDAEIHRHYYWCNFKIYPFHVESNRKHRKIRATDGCYGFDLAESKIKDKRKALRNMVDPELGRHILQCAEGFQEPVNFGLFE